MNDNKKESLTFVPQEISRHFIEPTKRSYHHQIRIKETYFDYSFEEEEDEYYDSGEEGHQPNKWSFVRNIFSKLTVHKPMSSAKYGSLQHSKLIGEGVSATVQLIQQDNMTFAVKVFKKRKRRENRSGYMKAITSEFCILSALNHQHIIHVFDFIKIEDHYSIIMEYCSQGDLYTLIKQAKLSDEQITFYFKQLLAGLHYLHTLGVAHRDLKPENLLIGSDNLLKIADFGSADVFRVAYQDHSRLSDGLCGTTPYMAPEIFLDSGYWAAPVDIWATGIILFCMKFDGVPFHSAQLADSNYPIYLKRLHAKQSYQPFNAFTQQQQDIIYKTLNPEWEHRITIEELIKLI